MTSTKYMQIINSWHTTRNNIAITPSKPQTPLTEASFEKLVILKVFALPFLVLHQVSMHCMSSSWVGRLPLASPRICFPPAQKTTSEPIKSNLLPGSFNAYGKPPSYCHSWRGHWWSHCKRQCWQFLGYGNKMEKSGTDWYEASLNRNI